MLPGEIGRGIAEDFPSPLVAVGVPDAAWQDSLLVLLSAAGVRCLPFAEPMDLHAHPFATAPHLVVLTGSVRRRPAQAAAPVAALREAGVSTPVVLLVPGPLEAPLACRLLAFEGVEVLENPSSTAAIIATVGHLARRQETVVDAPLSPLARRALGMMLGGRSRRTIASRLSLRLPELDAVLAEAAAAWAAPGMVALLRAARRAGIMPD